MAARYILVITHMAVTVNTQASMLSCGQESYQRDLSSAIVDFTQYHKFPQVIILYTDEYLCTTELIQAHPQWITKTSIWKLELLHRTVIQTISDIYSFEHMIIILASTNTGNQLITKTQKEFPSSAEWTWLLLCTESWESWNHSIDPGHCTIYLGIVGNVSHPGQDSVYDFMIHSLVSSRLERIGSWSPESGILFTSEQYWNFTGFKNRMLHVVTSNLPMFHYRQTIGNKTVWKGICIEMLNSIAEALQFQYYLSEPSDGKWGAQEANGSWNGMVGQVLRQEVDLALGKFTITQARDTVIDYTHPYWHEPSQMVMKKPKKDTLLLYLRPFKWQAASICPPFLEHAVIGAWMIFLLVTIGTYSGNLVASLAVPMITLPVQSLEELAKSDYHSGAMRGTALSTLFESSSRDVYKMIWRKSMQYEKNMVDSEPEGFERVLSDDKYVFITEASGIHNALANDNNCELALAKEEFFPSSFGLVFPENSPLLPLFNKRIIKLVESGLLTKWRNLYYPVVNCTLVDTSAESNPAALDDVIGVFIMLGVGLISAVCLLCLECTFCKCGSRTMKT